MKKKIGIWLDAEKAVLVCIEDGEQSIEKINSEVESHLRYPGETRAYTRFGKQFFDNKSSKEERHKHQLAAYFKDIERHLGGASSLYIFGPAETRIEFEKELRKSKSTAQKIKAAEPCDHMSDNQIAAKVRDFFSKENVSA